MGKTVYLTERQLNIGIEAFYNMYVDYLGSGDPDDMNEEQKKNVDACERAIIKLGGRI
jgi:hypothetical protein